jgi:hypothetical protein
MKKLFAFVIASATMLALAAPASADTYIDLQSAGLSGNDGAVFFIQGDNGKSAGTGVFPAFNRIQANNNEEGYSTSPNILDNTNDDTHNFAIQKKLLGVFTCPAGSTTCAPGAQYYEFHLDINEAGGGNEWLSLDDVRLFWSTQDNLATEPFPSPATQVYNMTDTLHILMNFQVESGSGKDDMTMLIPVALLAGAGQNDFIYLYSSFGAITNCTGQGSTAGDDAKCVAGADYTSSDGFEEWNFLAGPGVIIVPDGGSTLGLLGLGMLTLGYVRRRFGKN